MPLDDAVIDEPGYLARHGFAAGSDARGEFGMRWRMQNDGTIVMYSRSNGEAQ